MILNRLAELDRGSIAVATRPYSKAFSSLSKTVGGPKGFARSQGNDQYRSTATSRRRLSSLCEPTSRPLEEHLRHLLIDLDHLQQNGILVRYDKCTYGAKEVSFLGNRITPEGVHPLPEKVAAIQNFPMPSTVKAPWEFLAEMVYGDPLVVPAEFFPSAISSNDNVVGKYTPCHQTYKPPAKHYMLTDLHSATHVFLRNDTSKPPLMPSYTGPFIVIRHSPKAFLLNIHGKEDWVSIDRLKPAYLLPDDPPTLRLSKSGHPI
ncbi:uncharacterized protein [Palaemon carinicauda]|uniref:uncharacterized protein n=1 Tax=Palaemon carinicauda TaxID=392227 RepID=UPI0035B63AF7